MTLSSNKILKISKVFSRTPGARFRSEGKFSGQELREVHLTPAIKEAVATQIILCIDLDGTAGYGTSFLEEAFGGLIRVDKISLTLIQKFVEFNSTEEPFLIDEINKYMKDADDASRK